MVQLSGGLHERRFFNLWAPSFRHRGLHLHSNKPPMLGELWSFQGRYRTLHLTWFAFFLTFVVWFNLAPLATTVKADLELTVGQIRTVAICNVALTIPARVLIGMLLDKYGPRLTYSTLLVF